jgi:type IV secretory pathway protease TraF
MPRGIYIKIPSNELEIGDIIIFNTVNFKGKLLKYVLAIDKGEFCLDREGTLWVDRISQVQRNIEKYPESIPLESICQQLKKHEVLVVGEHPDSYDSRYFGPIDKNDIVAKVKLLF